VLVGKIGTSKTNGDLKMQITLDISEKAYKKLMTAATTKRLLGSDHYTTSDILLFKILDAIQDEKSLCVIKTYEEDK
jgi:hypothetical protein